MREIGVHDEVGEGMRHNTGKEARSGANWMLRHVATTTSMAADKGRSLEE